MSFSAEFQHQGYSEFTWRMWACGGCFPFHTEPAGVMETLDLKTHGSKDRQMSIFSHVSLGTEKEKVIKQNNFSQ